MIVIKRLILWRWIFVCGFYFALSAFVCSVFPILFSPFVFPHPRATTGTISSGRRRCLLIGDFALGEKTARIWVFWLSPPSRDDFAQGEKTAQIWVFWLSPPSRNDFAQVHVKPDPIPLQLGHLLPTSAKLEFFRWWIKVGAAVLGLPERLRKPAKASESYESRRDPSLRLLASFASRSTSSTRRTSASPW